MMYVASRLSHIFTIMTALLFLAAFIGWNA
jgi:hypothetical protein